MTKRDQTPSTPLPQVRQDARECSAFIREAMAEAKARKGGKR